MYTINVSEPGVKARSKNEMYRLLTVEAKIYLPPRSNSRYNLLEIFIAALTVVMVSIFKRSSIWHNQQSLMWAWVSIPYNS